MTSFERFKSNLEIITELLTSKQVGLSYEQLSESYFGFGGANYFALPLANILNKDLKVSADSERYYTLLRILIERLQSASYSQEEIGSIFKNISNSSLTAFYTPQPIVDRIAQRLIFDGLEQIRQSDQNNPYRILDPSAGTGIFPYGIIKEFEKQRDKGEIPSQSAIQITALEPENISRHILLTLAEKYRNDESISLEVKSSKFQEFESDFKFDLITSNIPFGNIKVFDQKVEQQFLVNPNVHNYFFLRASQLLNENGRIGFLTSSSFLDTASDKYRKMFFEQGWILDGLVRLPRETFATTAVQTDYIQITKIGETTAQQKQILEKLIYSPSFSADSFGIPMEAIVREKVADQNYHINQYVFENQAAVLVGQWTPAVLHQRPVISTTSKSQDEILSKFGALIAVEKRTEQKKNLRQDPVKKETSKPVFDPNGVQLSLFDLAGFMDDPEPVKQKKSIENIEEWPVSFSFTELDQAGIYHYNSAFVHYNGEVYFLTVNPENAKHYLADHRESGEKFRRILDIKNSYLKLNNAVKNGLETGELHQQLMEQYEQFHTAFGSLTENTTALVDDFHLSEFKALETLHDGKFLAAEILTNAAFFDQKNILTERGAIFRSLQIQRKIDVGYIFDQLSMPATKEEKLSKVSDWIQKDYVSADIYKTENGHIKFRIVPNDEFMSGNVPEKIALYEQTLADGIRIPFMDRDQTEKHLNRLRAADIRLSSMDQITISIGNEWMDKKYLSRFLCKVFDLGHADGFFSYNKFDGFYLTNNWVVTEIDRNNAFAVYRSTGNRISPSLVLCDIINDISPYYTNTIEVEGNKRKILDKKAIAQAQQKAADLKNQWQYFLKELPEAEKQNILYRYNELFCSNVPRQFDGSYLDFSNIEGIKDLGTHQKEAVAKIIHDDGGIIDIRVGGGKSLIMFATVMKMREMGLKQKPLIAALNSTAEQIYNEFKFHYPEAKVFYKKPKAYTLNGKKVSVEEARREMYAEIANNDWDCVIMTHEQICNIPVPVGVEQAYVQDQIDDLYENFYYLKGQSEKGITNSDLKKLEYKVQNKISKLQHQLQELERKKDNTKYDIISMGIDHIFVDECHRFKKMPFVTIYQKVSGLPNGESQRANYMAMITRAMHETYGHDKGLTVLSGTVANNSIAEIYIMMHWVYPNRLEQAGLGTFDKFAKVFFKKSVQEEVSVTNATKPKERFRTIVNIPELKKLYKSMAIVKNDYNLTLSKPELDVEFVSLDIDNQQQYLNDLLIDFCDGNLDAQGWQQFETITGNTYDDDQMQAASLITTNFSRMNSIDAKLINPDLFEVNPNGKLYTCAKNIKEYYDRFDEMKGTQLVFSDFALPAPRKPFDCYNGIINILVNEYHIPCEEIAIVHDWQDRSFGTKKDKALRKEFDRKVNAGELRIVFGSTNKLGTGRNVQKRVVAMHHIDIPWNPSDNEQRNGRGARQGNEVAAKYCNNTVKCFYYASKKSLDAFLYQTLEYKQKYIDEFKKIDGITRIIDEGAVDAEGNVNYREMKAYILDNKYMIEVAELERKIESLENMKQGIEYNRTRLNRRLLHFQDSLSRAQRNVENLQKIHEVGNELFKNTNPETVQGLPPISIFKDKEWLEVKTPDRNIKQIGQQIHNEFDKIRKMVEKFDFNELKKYNQFLVGKGSDYKIPLMKMGDFVTSIDIAFMKFQISTRHPEFETTFIKRQPVIPADTKAAVMTIYNEVMERSEKLIKNSQENIKLYTSEIDSLTKQHDQVHHFDRDEELHSMKQDLSRKKILLEQENENIKKKKAVRVG